LLEVTLGRKAQRLGVPDKKAANGNAQKSLLEDQVFEGGQENFYGEVILTDLKQLLREGRLKSIGFGVRLSRTYGGTSRFCLLDVPFLLITKFTFPACFSPR
jgi:hypothetical protein